MSEANRLKDRAIDAIEAFGGKEIKAVVDLGIAIIDIVGNRQKDKEERLRYLSSASIDNNFAYNAVLVKNFVKRRINFYNLKKSATLKSIENEISYQKIARNVIITGQAGVGKSTVLKWLYVNAYVDSHIFSHVAYISSKMVMACTSLEELGVSIDAMLKGKGRCLVFFDGLDELPFVTGKHGELEKFLHLFDDKVPAVLKKQNHKFVLSTRPEHFKFYAMIKNKGTTKALNTYVVYEVQPLDAKESHKICMLNKKLHDFEIKEGLTSPHFSDKWPEKDMGKGLNEKKFIKCLQDYLGSTDISESLLQSPLLCRYAYQIISDWESSKNHKPSDNKLIFTLSTQIERVITSYVKWEYHDRYHESTHKGMGKERFQKYGNKVFGFLASVAEIIYSQGSIKRSEWEKLKGKARIDVNSALCVLQEDNKGHLLFIHKSFMDYFLARYFVNTTTLNPEKTEEFAALLTENSSFSLMYTELLLTYGNAFSKKICENLLEKCKGKIEELSEYVRGNYCFHLNANCFFTVVFKFISFWRGGICSTTI